MRRTRLFGLLAVTVGAAVLGLRASAGGPMATAASAAWRAFRDPALLERKPEPPPALDCRKFEGDAARLDAQIATDFREARAEDPLDDPEDGAVRSLAMPDVPIPLTRRTLRYVRFFTKTDPGRSAFSARFRRASVYRQHIEFALREAGLPEDLVWLVAIESGFDPRSISPSGAAGLWQMMPETGALYGLDQSEWVDERRSIARATTGAVAHLRDLYERFHRWDLALAAYNMGFDGVVRAMDKTAARGRRLSTFSELAAAHVLPEETSSYVPQIHAFAIVAANRARFGLDQTDLGQPIELGEIAVPQGTRLRTIARSAGMSSAALRELNPQILRDRVPPTGGDYLVTVPADRVQHALATFPALAEHEVVGESEAADVAPDIEAPHALPAFDEPLTERPRQLGRNRLPEVAGLGPSTSPDDPSSFFANRSVFDTRLPMMLVGVGSGWRARVANDPLGVYEARDTRAKTGSAALEKELGFLREPSRIDDVPAYSLPSGVVVRVRRDPGAAFTAVTVRVSSRDQPETGREGRFEATKASVVTRGEATSSMVVDRKDADAAVELAAARVRLLAGQASDATIVASRRRATEPRRRALLDAPYGHAWLALGDALFPKGSPLEGYVVGARDDATSARETMLVEAMREERARAKAEVTIVGDVDEARAHQLLESFLGGASWATHEATTPYEGQARVRIEEDVPATHALFGWVAPGEDDALDATARVLAELLQNPKIGGLARRLGAGTPGAPITAAVAALDVAPSASVFAIDLALARGAEAEAEAEKRLDDELTMLAREGPTAAEVGAARVYLGLRLEKQKKAEASARLPVGTPHATSLEHLHHALHPHALEHAIRSLDDVTPRTVQALVKRWFGSEHRAVIVTAPKGSVTNY